MPIDLNQPPVVAALVGGGVAAAVSLATAVINQVSVRSMHRQRIAADIDLAERKFRFDRELAERKFTYERELNHHKRRVELAEEVLSGFLRMRDIVREIRSPAAFSNEGQDRPSSENETNQQAEARRVYFVPASRLLRYSDFINNLMAKRYQMDAYFGSDTEESFNRIWEVLAHIQSAARMMMASIDPQGHRQGENDLWREWQSAIWADWEVPDPYAQMVEEAISRMETICRPVLTKADA